MKKSRNGKPSKIKQFFFPPANTPLALKILPYAILGVCTLAIVIAGAYGWEYTNSPEFCGTTCHTMPPQNAAYVISPHANVYCSECHIGRAFIGKQLGRKVEDARELYAMVFQTYEFPIVAHRSRPARETCEQCHLPETFVDDSLRINSHFGDDLANTSQDIYIIMQTGGGVEQEGLGRGIHWHIVNQVYYYAVDQYDQEIPYIRVVNDDGSYTEYVDVETGFDPSSVDENQLNLMDCITCHNRVSHSFEPPEVSVDTAMARGLIDPSIPGIHKNAVEVLSASYPSREEAMKAIESLDDVYQERDDYADLAALIQEAIHTIKDIYDRTVFIDQKVDWKTHPENLGHMFSPGCFRCHDGKHLDDQQQAVRLECNLCHSIPVVVDSQDFIATIEISRGPEPESHFNANWISLHNQVFEQTCANCHTTTDPGGISNTSFCSNSACHGIAYSFAGFDAPSLREILQAQLPIPSPQPTILTSETPTFSVNILPVLENRCTMCHNPTSASAGLSLSSFQDILLGSENGPVVISGDPTNSRFIILQSEQHFANLSPEELEMFINWIAAGALED